MIDIDDRSFNKYTAFYKDVPEKFKNYFIKIKDNEYLLKNIKLGDIQYWSDNKEELETFLTAKNYNL